MNIIYKSSCANRQLRISHKSNISGDCFNKYNLFSWFLCVSDWNANSAAWTLLGFNVWRPPTFTLLCLSAPRMETYCVRTIKAFWCPSHSKDGNWHYITAVNYYTCLLNLGLSLFSLALNMWDFCIERIYFSSFQLGLICEGQLL